MTPEQLSFDLPVREALGVKAGDRLRYVISEGGVQIFKEPAERTHVDGSALREALDALEEDHEFLLAGDVFTKSQIEGYMELKWEEVYAYEHTPHPMEYKLYYSC